MGTWPFSHLKRNADKIVTIAKPVAHLLDSFKTCHNYVYSSTSSKESSDSILCKYTAFKILSPCKTATTVWRIRKKFGELTKY